MEGLRGQALLFASAIEDAGRWRRLVNGSELASPVIAMVDDPENDAIMCYGRKRMEALIDMMDEIPNSYNEDLKW